MSNAQTWTLIGLVGTLVTGLLAAIGAMHTSVRGSMGDLRASMGDLRTSMGVRFDGVDRRLDALDRDVQVLSDRVFRDRP